MHLIDGIIQQAAFIPSPNFDLRPAGCNPQLLIIHAISLPPGKYGGDAIEKLFTNQLCSQQDPYFSLISNLRVSAHFLIRRDGALIQFVNTAHRAWHAGASCYQGRENVNDFSIGVELEGLDASGFEAPQYQALLGLTKCLQAVYTSIDNRKILGHQHIAPSRKSDPGCGFQWYDYLSALQSANVNK